MSAMRLTLKTINNELAKRGHMARLAKASDYFYFHLGEAADWLDRVVRVPTVSSLSLEQWLEEFERLKKVDAELFKPVKAARKKRQGVRGRGGHFLKNQLSPHWV
jgi:hypothetical protein